jgi:hypothetical protein
LSPNSKKCSTAERFAELAGVILIAGFASFASSVGARAEAKDQISVEQAAPMRLTMEARPTPSGLAREITTRSASQTFDRILQTWEGRYGSEAVAPLLQVAAGSVSGPTGRPLEDADRYVALMGAAKLGGQASAPLLTRFLKDKSWMIRSGALRALTALNNPATAPAVLPLLKDAALVVRLEAVDAVEKLRPHGAAEALMGTLALESNYHGGKAQWVPQKALSALTSMKAVELAPRLKPLLDHDGDTDLLKQTVATLESLTGKTLKKGGSLNERIREWKVALAPSAPAGAAAP